ncbi:MAG: hypothetical protein P8Y69_18715, partial [Gammaproteobacteria bacterium]
MSGHPLRRTCCILLLAAAPWLLSAPRAWADERLVFGSFQSLKNAQNWANRVGVLLDLDMQVERSSGPAGDTWRVVTAELADTELLRVRRVADTRRLSYWRLLDVEQTAAATGETEHAEAVPERPVAAVPPPVRPRNPQEPVGPRPPVRPAETIRPTAREATRVQMFDVDLGAQARTFFKEGLDGQSRFHPSVSIKADYYLAWNDERQSLTFAPFYRYDGEDDERTLFDIREGFWSLVGDDWDLHLGVKQVFWGVTEFNHLVDIINQNDLVENIDGEDKLGQPMAHLSLVRNW